MWVIDTSFSFGLSDASMESKKSDSTLPPVMGQNELLTRVKELQELACCAVAQDQAGQLKASITSYEQVCPHTCVSVVMHAYMYLFIGSPPINVPLA